MEKMHFLKTPMSILVTTNAITPIIIHDINPNASAWAIIEIKIALTALRLPLLLNRATHIFKLAMEKGLLCCSFELQKAMNRIGMIIAYKAMTNKKNMWGRGESIGLGNWFKEKNDRCVT